MVEEKLPQILVRGISLISLGEYVKSRLKSNEERRFFTRLPAMDAEIILTAQKWQWYPFSTQRSLREGIAQRFDPRNPLDAIYDAGYYAAERETSTFLRAMLGFFSPRIVLRNANVIWSKYYSLGKLQGTFVREGFGIVELTGFPSDSKFCPMVTSWLTVASSTLKLSGAEVTKTACMHNNDPLCRWEIHWRILKADKPGQPHASFNQMTFPPINPSCCRDSPLQKATNAVTPSSISLKPAVFTAMRTVLALKSRMGTILIPRGAPG
ncbi:hypothetical protein GF359_01620 [candidate division WOR-3 bacterium]|uniref:4-vinyl reductase 4VR domain-containing protein n=1 Tax=candidate division WOR-3 bacterium TaxID=2052148 RepID=A0A9D5K7Y6_UNCW3|nr:hypothetical protein [candidate division WOR-3 bacterium]MBD3363892.1 hypothetical protein [candidate division WOR-3 bacterium]